MSIWLVMKTAAGEERPFAIRKDRTVIGREATSDVRVAMPSVAPRHCEIVVRNDQLRLSDLGSGRGTLHNGTPVREAVLTDTDEVTVGPVTFLVRCGGDVAFAAEPNVNGQPGGPTPTRTTQDDGGRITDG
jgi:pSer/pThr/pTyr-binding forkhead associated (FHA) protein